MRKILITVFVIASLVCGALVLTACNNERNQPPPAHAHDYRWVDNGDGTHKRHCVADCCDAPDIDSGSHDFSDGNCICGKIKPVSEHTCSYTRESAEDEYRKTWASCTSKAVYYKSCSVCGAKGADTFEYGDFTEHPFTAWTDDEDGNHTRICSCGASETEPHDFSDGNCVCGKAKPIVATAGLEFELNYNDPYSYRVKSIGTATDIDIVIPSEYNGKPVTSINGYVFKNNATIESVTIPDSVSHIGNDAFINCAALKSITVGSGILYIDNEIFDGSYIEIASIPAILAKYVNNAELKTVRITSGTTIEDEAFVGCAELTSITIADTVTSIGKKAFQNCRSLTCLDIPDSVESIGAFAFDGCNSLSSISVGENNQNYASQDGILYNKTKTEFVHVPKAISDSVVIPDSVTFIGIGTFGGRSSLTEIVLQSGVTLVCFGAFYNCTTLVSVTIPNSVTSIEEDAFANCSALTLIRFNGTKEQWGAVAKDYNWDINTGAYIVRCIDGDIDKETAP